MCLVLACTYSEEVKREDDTMREWQILARHKWVCHAVITESYRECDNMRRFTATIHGFHNYRIWEGPGDVNHANIVIDRVLALRDQIEKGELP